jgi:hypothetical protein
VLTAQSTAASAVAATARSEVAQQAWAAAGAVVPARDRPAGGLPGSWIARQERLVVVGVGTAGRPAGPTCCACSTGTSARRTPRPRWAGGARGAGVRAPGGCSVTWNKNCEANERARRCDAIPRYYTRRCNGISAAPPTATPMAARPQSSPPTRPPAPSARAWAARWAWVLPAAALGEPLAAAGWARRLVARAQAASTTISCVPHCSGENVCSRASSLQRHCPLSLVYTRMRAQRLLIPFLCFAACAGWSSTSGATSCAWA